MYKIGNWFQLETGASAKLETGNFPKSKKVPTTTTKLKKVPTTTKINAKRYLLLPKSTQKVLIAPQNKTKRYLLLPKSTQKVLNAD